MALATTGRMRFDSRVASSTSQWHISDRAEDGDSTNTIVSACAMWWASDCFHTSPPDILRSMNTS